MATTFHQTSTPSRGSSPKTITLPRSMQSPVNNGGTGISSPLTSANTLFDQQRLEAELLERPYLPECWSDERRMAVLFSPFRVRDVNPESWDLKMNFWTTAISKWCLQTRTVAFNLEDVRRAFSRRGGEQYPHTDCLRLVLSTMKRKGALLLEEELPIARNARTLGRTLLTWSVNSLLLKPLSLGWSFLAGSSGSTSPDARARGDSATDNGVYSSSSSSSSSQDEKPLASVTAEAKLFSRETLALLVESVEAHLKNLTPSSPIRPGACLRYQHFTATLNRTLFAERPLDEATFAIVIEVIEAKGAGARLKTMLLEAVAGSGVGDIRIVKIAGSENNNVSINERDISLIMLEAAKEVLLSEADRLDDQVDALREEARQALTSRSREKARLLLERKKRLDKKITEKHTAISNIERIYLNVLDTHTAQAVTRAMACANDVLKRESKAMFTQAEDTMNAVEETMDDIAALSAEVNRPLATDAEVDLEVEEELDQMLKEMEQEKKKEKDEDGLLKQLNQLKILEGESPTAPKTSTEKKVLVEDF